MRILSTTAVLALLLLAGCSGDGPDSSSSSSSATSSSTTTAPPSCLAENALRDRLDVLALQKGTLEVFSTVAGKNASYGASVDPAREAFGYGDGNVTMLALGNEFYVVNATGNATRHRDLADPSMAERLQAHLLGGVGTDDASPFFASPSHLFSATCAQESGKTVHVLLRESGGIRERWKFAENGTFLEATFTQSSTETSGTIKHNAKAQLPETPDDAVPGALVHYVHIQSSDGPDAYRIEPSTPGSRYADLRFRFMRSDGTIAQTVNMPSPSDTAFGSIKVVDHGKPGIVDDGDLWLVDLGTAKNFTVYDTWSRANVTFKELPAGAGAIPAAIDADPLVVKKAYTWTHAGKERKANVQIPEALLRRDEARVVPRNALGPAYDLLVHDARSAGVVGQLADQLVAIAEAEAMPDADLAALALSFVQSLKDGFPASRPDDRFLRTPAMTLAADGGDSEDNAVLLAALFEALGQDSILLRGDRHTSVGVALNGTSPGATIAFQSVRYWQAEPTPGGPALGLPDPNRPRPEPIDLAPRTVLGLEPEPIDADLGLQHATVVVANDGRRDTMRGELVAYMQTNATSQIALARDVCAFPALLPGASHRCDFWLPDGPTIKIRLMTLEGVVQS